MRLFECQHCRQPLFFENDACDSCGRRLGFIPELRTMSALEPDGYYWKALADTSNLYRFCANAEFGVCNWLVQEDSPKTLCAACRHNRTVADLSIPENVARWRKIEIAKHRLFYTLLRLHLPHPTRNEEPERGLAFDFLASTAPSKPIITGHASGLITLSLSEADDSERERVRNVIAEPYRTLLGHFRHEIGHYYWDLLVRHSSELDEFRRVFGDERDDYSAALKRHYEKRSPRNWSQSFVSPYASAHPWEDFAETWAHYFHMIDTLETAGAYGIKLVPKVAKSHALTTKIDFDPHRASLERIIDAWLPLSFAMNSINRSMGLPDLYPFVLGPGSGVKIAYIHELVRACVGDNAARDAAPAAVAVLKRGLAEPIVAKQSSTEFIADRSAQQPEPSDVQSVVPSNKEYREKQTRMIDANLITERFAPGEIATLTIIIRHPRSEIRGKWQGAAALDADGAPVGVILEAQGFTIVSEQPPAIVVPKDRDAPPVAFELRIEEQNPRWLHILLIQDGCPVGELMINDFLAIGSGQRSEPPLLQSVGWQRQI